MSRPACGIGPDSRSRTAATRGTPHLARFASLRCLDLERAFELWEAYNGFLDEQLATVDPAAVLELRYEDLLSAAPATLRRVADHVGLAVGDAALEKATADVRPGRRLAFRDDPELTEFAARVGSRESLSRWRDEASS